MRTSRATSAFTCQRDDVESVENPAGSELTARHPFRFQKRHNDVVVFDTLMDGEHIVNKPGPRTVHLVSRDRRTDPAAAKRYATA